MLVIFHFYHKNKNIKMLPCVQLKMKVRKSLCHRASRRRLIIISSKKVRQTTVITIQGRSILIAVNSGSVLYRHLIYCVQTDRNSSFQLLCIPNIIFAVELTVNVVLFHSALFNLFETYI